MAEGSDDGPPPIRRRDHGYLSIKDVGERLRIHRETVRAIPRDQLPYLETPGGSQRVGRRRYREADVVAYERLLEERARTVEEDHERRLSALEEWRRSVERGDVPD